MAKNISAVMNKLVPIANEAEPLIKALEKEAAKVRLGRQDYRLLCAGRKLLTLRDKVVAAKEEAQ